MSIDYGKGTLANIDPKTGLRYGIISPRSLHLDFWDRVDCEYDQECPKCSSSLCENWADDYDPEDFEVEPDEDYDDHCPHCGEGIEHDDTIGDEPSRMVYAHGSVCNLGVWVFESEFYTYCAHCSPCCPGAGDLDNEGTAKTLCLGPDYFDGPPPYPVFRVSDDSRVC